MSHPFQLVAGHVALDFANTLDFRFDPSRTVDLLPSYDRFVDFALQSGLITPANAARLSKQSGDSSRRAALKSAIELREALELLFRSVVSGKAPGKSSLEVLNRFLARSKEHESLVWRNSEFVREYGNLSERPDGPIWPLLDAAIELLTSPARGRIRECKDPSCRWLFLDHSKNLSRRWCDMQICGNRTKVRKFRERRA
jgi:predicted RNA-binding Zn ribbon-like protein